MIKWNTNEIIKFLEIYKSYGSLWNTKSVDYTNKMKRKIDFQLLFRDLLAAGLVSVSITLIDVKAKIKSLRDAFRQEALKVVKSKNSGAAFDEIYKPKLGWYDNAKFLLDVLSTRENLSNLDFTDIIEYDDIDSDKYKSPERSSETQFLIEPAYSPTDVLENTNLKTDETFEFPNLMDSVETSLFPNSQPPAQTQKHENGNRIIKKTKKLLINSALKKLDTICSNDDEFERFGKYIAAQLRRLPLRDSTLLQQDIQNLITKSILNNISQDAVTT